MAFNIDKICSTINQIIEKLTIPFAYIPPEILVCSAIRRPGLSAIAIVSNIISRKSEAGAHVGLSADGTPNVEEAVERIRIEEIVKGIKNSIGSVRSAVSNVASNIKSFLHFSVPDEGPLTDYESWMPDFIQGMTNGINDNKYRLVDAVQGMAGDMRMTMPSVANPRLKNIGGNNMQMQSTQSSDEKLYTLLTQLINKVDNTGNITIPVYLGNDLIDEQIIRSNDRRTLRSGGRA